MINLFDISIQIRRLIKLFSNTLFNLNIILPLEVLVIIIFLIGFYFLRKIINTLCCNRKYKKINFNENLEKKGMLIKNKEIICKEKLIKKLYMIKKLVKENILNKNLITKIISEIKNNNNFKNELEKYNLYKNKDLNSKVKKNLNSLEKIIKNKFNYDDIKSKLVVIVLLYYIDNKK